MRFEDHPVIPVIKINDAKKAAPLARALLDGGISAVEITLRTVEGLSAIANIAKAVPEIEVGAGAALNVASGTDLYVYDRDEYVGKGFVFSNTDLKTSYYQPDFCNKP